MKTQRIPFLLVLWIIGLGTLLAPPAAPGAAAPDPADKIMRAIVFRDRIVWIGKTPPPEQESRQLLALIEALRGKSLPATIGGFESFVAANPNSAWTPSLKANLGYFYYQSGRYTLALSHWETAWDQAKGMQDRWGKHVADYSLAHWTRLLASLGREEELAKIFKETKDRALDRGPLSQKFARTMEATMAMRTRPGGSFKCGTYALHNVAIALQVPKYTPKALLNIPSPRTGFAISVLEEYSRELKLDLIAAKRPVNGEIIVPSVTHLKQGHYAAIVGRHGPYYKVVDPTFGNGRFVSLETLDAETSGYYLVPRSQKPDAWPLLSKQESTQIFGRGNPYVLSDDDDGECEPSEESGECCKSEEEGGAGGGSGGGNSGPCAKCKTSGPPPGRGMPVWRVSEPFINVWIEDEPFGYQPTKGKRLSGKMSYRQRDEWGVNQVYNFGFGLSWNSQLRPWVSFDTSLWPAYTYATVHYPGGSTFEVAFSGESAFTNYINNTRVTVLTNSIANITGLRVSYPGGATEIYDFGLTDWNTNLYNAFLTSRTDRNGSFQRYIYDSDELTNSIVRLLYIVDPGGGTNAIAYATNSAYSTNLISSITDPYGRTATFAYDDSTGQLTNIVDVAGLSSTIVYNYYGWPTNLITPYGTNVMQYVMPWLDHSSEGRAVTVTEPNGGKHFYYYNEGLSTVPEAYPEAEIPTNTPYATLQTNYLNWRLSLYWNPHQYTRLSTNYTLTEDVAELTTNDCKIARLRAWLADGDGTSLHARINTLSLERSPSPDAGTTDGQKTWFDYPGKPGEDFLFNGTQRLPGVIARVLPDGSTWYRWFRRNGWGTITNMVETFSTGLGASIQLRTNAYIYSTNEVDLLQHICPDGNVHASYGYNTNHQVIAFTNAVGYVTSYTYDTNGHLASVSRPSGLTTTNIYNASGYLEKTIDIEIARTNTFTYTNGLVFSHTNERGLTTTNTWDGLQRLTSRIYPDGTCSSNIYTYLDLAATKDRLGNWSYFKHNSIRQNTAVTNALGRVTTFTYCDCGAIETITDALTNVTTFTYDYNGNMLRQLRPDSSYATNVYNLIGQLERTGDSGGVWTTNYYNNQGLLVVVSNAAGRLLARSYDVEDRLTNSVDASGTVVSTTYDDEGRILTLTYPDGGMISHSYSARGLTSSTNQLGFVSNYGYDEGQRKLAETNANGEIIRHTYNAANDLLTVVDGNGQTNGWNFNQYGQATNKVDATGAEIFRYQFDANGRLTNRWSVAKGNTGYAYNVLGNLTSVNYPTSPDLSFAYDAANRLTNMVDAVGTTRYAYVASSLLSEEDGPWADDTVTYAYNGSQQRTSLSLQQPFLPPASTGYGYDTSGRLQSIASTVGMFVYAYDGAGRRVNALFLPNGCSITNGYDNVSRLTSTYLRNSAGIDLNHHIYHYDAGHHRTNITRYDGSKITYSYDNIGQLKSATGKEADNTVRLHEKFGYAYDAAGNLNFRTNNALFQTFSVDALNQLATNTRSGTFTAAGITLGSPTNVTVNGAAATRYGDGTFAKEGLSLSDGTNTFTAIAQDAAGRSDTNESVAYLPAVTLFQYDGNGNLLSDGRRAFAYDDENQLTSALVTNAWKSEFVYDGKRRRKVRKEYSWQDEEWVQTNEVRYVYEGRLVIQERNENNQPTVSYARGSDLSGTLQGAGGIGGMLARYEHSLGLVAYYHADGGGNITTLVDLGGSIVARYLYDPFGRELARSGSQSDANLYRYASKEKHHNSDSLYYLYRYYIPEIQRWLNRDPIHEKGGLNLYTFAFNSPNNMVDFWGLQSAATIPCGPRVIKFIGTRVLTKFIPGVGWVALAVEVYLITDWIIDKCQCVPKSRTLELEKTPDCKYIGSRMGDTMKICIYQCTSPLGAWTGWIKVNPNAKCPSEAGADDVNPLPDVSL
mgnify:CR=1 FL=1